MAIARRAELAKEESAVYLDGVRDLPAWAVERTCRHLSAQPRGEYESAMPELGVIVTRAQALVRQQREAAESSRLLSAPPVEPVSPEKVQDFMRQIRAAIGRKVMP